MFADRKQPWPLESINKALLHEVGEMQRKWADGRSFLTDWIAKAAEHPTREKRQFEVKKQIENHLAYRLKAHLGNDQVEVTAHYTEAGNGRFSVEAWNIDANSFNFPVTEFFSLDFAPEPHPLITAPVEPPPKPQKPQPTQGGKPVLKQQVKR